MAFKNTMALLLSLFLITSCASKPTEFNDSEDALSTGGPTTQQFHSVVYYPHELSLNFPGYIVGLEKVPVENITDNPKDVILTSKVPNNDVSDTYLFGKVVEKKTLLVTHIMNSRNDNSCAIYSAYESDSEGNLERCSPVEHYPGNLYEKSWQAMDSLRTVLKEDISDRLTTDDTADDYTHIIIVVMGWNTNQEEAVRNFNSLGSNLIAASKGKANPLFIGLSWPSLWESSIVDPLFKLVSYPNKADDADEVGLTWLGVLIHETIKGLEVPKTVVIGHSFGARATSMASCVGPAITRDGTMLPRNNVDMLISLQGAYSMNRFYPNDGIEKLHYQGCEQAGKVLLTSSVHDLAMDTGPWAPFVGNETTFKEFCIDKTADKFSCQKVGSSGVHDFSSIQEHFIYVDSDDLIKYNAHKSGGGAHSDIYRIQMGNLIWSALEGLPGANK